MADQTARGEPLEMSLEAVVIRCGCGAPDSHRGVVCPQPRREDLGTVSYWHRNPFKRLMWALRNRRKAS